MESLLKFQTLLLFLFWIPPENSVRGTPCAEIRVQAPVTVLGSLLNASCSIAEDCPLVEGQSFSIMWRLNGRILAGQPLANQSSRISSVTVASFSDVEAVLECYVCPERGCQIVEGVTVKGGHQPSAPQNLTCVTNLTRPLTLTCKWDPGKETHLPTNYTLLTEISDGSIRRSAYPLPVGRHVCTIPRKGFMLYRKMRISVTAQNALGTASSEPLSLDPMDFVKFDPPVLVEVKTEPHRYGCLRLQWRLAEQQQWVIDNLAVQVRLKIADSEPWTTETKNITSDDQREALQQCGLLHGADYLVQMRVRLGSAPWSEWGNSRTGATLEKAPTGKLDVWLKVLEEKSQTQNYVQLFWKPSSQFQANGKNVSFEVFLSHAAGRVRHKTVCRTPLHHCEAVLPKSVRKVYFTAFNSGGEARPSPVTVYQHRGMERVSNLTVSSAGDASLRVTWTPPVSAVAVGYVLEWGPQLQRDPGFLRFLLLEPNQTAVLISDGVEPYSPYWFSVYAKYHNGIGVPRTAQGYYSLQRAPSAAPSMRVGDIHHAHAKLSWEPIPLEQRNGIIRNYTVYYWDNTGRTRAIYLSPSVKGVTLPHLSPMSQYKAFISASTEGGSVNGTVVTFKTAPADPWGDLITVVLACVGLALCFILTLACLTKQDRLKMHFWPMIPDPANSSIKCWTDEATLPDYPAFQSMKDMQDPVPVHLSWFSLLDVPEGLPEKSGSGGPTMDDLWLQGCDPCDPQNPLQVSSQGSEPAKEAVPYATVVFANPYLSQERAPTSTYQRSDSTQPLLGEESPSPRAYQNFHFHEGGGARESMQSQGESSAFWEEFPLLSGLNMQEAQHESLK